MASGFDVAVDLEDYVSDAQSAASTLVFAVTDVTGPSFVELLDGDGAVLNRGTFVDNGGGVASRYSNVFASMGLYTVAFTVTDPDGNVARGSFQVAVDKGTLFVFEDETAGDLKLVDGGTGKIHDFSGIDGYEEDLRSCLSTGTIVFSRKIGAQYDLYAYLPAAGSLQTVASDPVRSETFVAEASGGQILFAKETTGGQTLHLYDPATQRTVNVATDPVDDLGAVLAGPGNIYYIRPNATGKGIYHFSMADGQVREVAATSSEALDLGLHAALANGDLAFWKLNASSYKDLYYYARSGQAYGVSTGNNSADSTFAEGTSVGHVLYTDGGSTVLRLYNSASRTNVAIEDGAVFDDDLGAGDYIVYTAAGALKYYRISTASAANTIVSATAVYKGKLSDDLTLVYFKSSDLHAHNLATADDDNISGSGAVLTGGFEAVLSNDDVVFFDSGNLRYFDASASDLAASTAVVRTVTDLGGSEAFEAALGGGKFVYSYNGRLYIWDAENGAAGASTTVDGAAGNTYLGCGSYSRASVAVASDATSVTTTVTTVSAYPVLFTRGGKLYTFRLITEIESTSVLDLSTQITTISGPTTTITADAEAVEAKLYSGVDVVSTSSTDVYKGTATVR